MKILLIGDVHAQTRKFNLLLAKHEPEYSIQLGDFGLREQHNWFLQSLDVTRHKIIFGNHDYIPYLSKPHSLGDWSFPFEGMMTIRGADSIDRRFRMTGVNWWVNEEMPFVRLKACIAAYKAACPEIVVSHECPHIVRRKVFGIHDISRTALGMQECLEAHRPKFWYFGHHHSSVRRVIDGTTFIGLNEMETAWVER